MGGDLAHVAIAVQGAQAGSPQALALAVAAKGSIMHSNCSILAGYVVKYSINFNFHRQIA